MVTLQEDDKLGLFSNNDNDKVIIDSIYIGEEKTVVSLNTLVQEMMCIK